MKRVYILLAVVLLAFSIVAGEAIAYKLQAPARCECLGNQPYIHTKWNGNKCLTRAYDPMNNFDGQTMVEYLYNSMEYCK